MYIVIEIEKLRNKLKIFDYKNLFKVILGYYVIFSILILSLSQYSLSQFTYSFFNETKSTHTFEKIDYINLNFTSELNLSQKLNLELFALLESEIEISEFKQYSTENYKLKFSKLTEITFEYFKFMNSKRTIHNYTTLILNQEIVSLLILHHSWKTHLQ